MHTAVATHWYASGMFWTVGGAVLALVAIIATIVLWLVGTPRGVLEYSLPVIAPLLSQDHNVHGVTVSLGGGGPLHDPHVVSFEVASRSRRDIRSADFDQQRPLVFDLGTNIVTTRKIDANGIVGKVGDHTITIGPALIRRRQKLTVDLLTDGVPAVTIDSPIADVTIRDMGSGSAEYYSVWTIAAHAVGQLIAASIFMILIAVTFRDNAERSAIGPVVSAGGAAFLIIALRIGWRLNRYNSQKSPRK
jgi:hypothetical protein